MTDYALTAGQQQQIINFLNAGKAVYVEGNDFGYYHKSHNVYKMFGCSYLGDSDPVNTMDGVDDTCMEGGALDYVAVGYTDDYMDWLGSTGGDLSLKANTGKYHLVSYAGPNGTYRSIHAAFWFGALKDGTSNYTKAEVMAAFMRYLKGDTLVLGLNQEISAGAGGSVDLFLETPAANAGREYAILGSATGTSPGIPLGTVVLPLNFDIFTQTVINLIHTPTMNNYHGNLDSAGRAMATFNTPAGIDPSAVGMELYFAYFLLNPENLASNPVTITIEN